MSVTVSRDADECVICDAPVPDSEEHGLTLDDPGYDLVIPLCSPACRDRYAELAVALGEGDKEGAISSEEGVTSDE